MSKQIKKPITVQEQLEMDIMAETELARLQRQYRIMDGDRKAFEEESRAQLQKQSKVMKLMNRERKQLDEDLRVAESKSHKRKDTETSAKLEILLNEYEKYNEAIKRQKTDLKEIEYQIRKVNRDVLIYKKHMDTVEVSQQKISGSAKSIEILKNKLEHCVKRFCTILAENRKLRDEIDHLLHERILFNESWKQQVETLNRGKKVMMDLVEQATIAYDQREEWCQKLQALRVRAHNDLIAHMTGMRELFRQLDHDASLQDFLSVKGQRRIMKDLEMKEQMKRHQAKENLEKELMHYKETLARVQELAGEEDISKLATQFIKQEEENFALFNYVNELNHELETLSDNIGNLILNIDEQREINAKRAEEQQDTIESLKTELKKYQDEESEQKMISTKQAHDLNQMLQGIGKMFKMIHCDSTPILNLLGETGEINTYNVMIYLGILENKVTDLIKITNYKEKAMPSNVRTRVIKSLKRRSTLTVQPESETPCPDCAEMYLISTILEKPLLIKNKNDITNVEDDSYYGSNTDLTENVLHSKFRCIQKRNIA